jgi:hypothetical protein
MPHIDSTQFGEVEIDGKKYSQVLIVGDSVVERDYEKLQGLFGTSHKIGDWETETLLKENPEVIIIGTGQDGKLEVDESFLEKMKEKGIEVIAGITPEAIKAYNEKRKAGKRVNALIHTTC